MNQTALKENRTTDNGIADITTKLAELQQMTVGQLREKFQELYGVPTRTRNKRYLQKKLAYRVQELAEGGLSGKALNRIDELAGIAPVRHRLPGNSQEPAGAQIGIEFDHLSSNSGVTAPSKPRDPRLPPAGECLTKTYKGTDHKVQVLEDGFEYEGKHYKSLSGIAREITKTAWNGFVFFGMGSRKATASK